MQFTEKTTDLIGFALIMIAISVAAVGISYALATHETTSTTITEQTTLNQSNYVARLGNNTYYIGCGSASIEDSGVPDCATKIQSFEETHKIVSLAAFEGDSYGKTAGYFVITEDTNLATV